LEAEAKAIKMSCCFIAVDMEMWDNRDEAMQHEKIMTLARQLRELAENGS